MIGDPPDDDWLHADIDPPDAAPANPPALRVVTEDDPQWARAMARGQHGTPTKDPGNCAIILAHAAAWRNVLRYDAFADRVTCGPCPPLPNLPDGWPSLAPPPPGDITDQHDIYAGLWLRRSWQVSWPTQAVRAGLVYAAKQHSFHPLRDYLNDCRAKWDRKSRLDEWMVDHLGVARSVYAYRVSSMYMISAVARAFDPGCKVDHVLVLEGLQGKGKTTALEIMFGKDWFLPDLPDLRDKDAMHLLAGCWCALADELSALRGAASVERAKSFFTRTVDVYRPPYSRDAVRRPRTTVFAATTNAPEYLTDETGNRRYWPVTCSGDLDFAGLREARDQIWGEACARYFDEERWWPEADIRGVLSEAQSERVVGDEWEGLLRKTLEGRSSATIDECLRSLLPETLEHRPEHQRRVGRALTRLGWELHRPWVTAADGSRFRERRYFAPGAWVANG